MLGAAPGLVALQQQKADCLRRAGQSRAFAALGPMLALPAGGVCALWWEPRAIFWVFAAVALCALLATRHLPAQPHALPPPPKRWGKLPGRLDRFSFVEGLVLDGLFIIGLSYLGRDVLPGHPVVVAGLLLSVRYLAEIALSVVGGDLAERYGAEVLLVGFAVLTSLALVGFGLGWLWTSALAIVILRALLLPLLPPLVARRTPGPGRIQALATRSVWRGSPLWLAHSRAMSASSSDQSCAARAMNGMAWKGLSAERVKRGKSMSPALASTSPLALTTAKLPK